MPYPSRNNDKAMNELEKLVSAACKAQAEAHTAAADQYRAAQKREKEKELGARRQAEKMETDEAQAEAQEVASYAYTMFLKAMGASLEARRMAVNMEGENSRVSMDTKEASLRAAKAHEEAAKAWQQVKNFTPPKTPREAPPETRKEALEAQRKALYAAALAMEKADKTLEYETQKRIRGRIRHFRKLARNMKGSETAIEEQWTGNPRIMYLAFQEVALLAKGVRKNAADSPEYAEAAGKWEAAKERVSELIKTWEAGRAIIEVSDDTKQAIAADPDIKAIRKEYFAP